MKKNLPIIIISVFIIVSFSSTVSATSSSDKPNLNEVEKAEMMKEYEKNLPVITALQQAEMDQLMAQKEAAISDYDPTESIVPEYIYITAEKLGVDITGLEFSEIIMKVKEAEVQYMIDNPVVLTPQQQAEMDQLMAQKEAAISDYEPTETTIPEYIYITAEKLRVDITGLEPSEIIMKVKEAEVQYMIDNPVVITPQQQAEYDEAIAEKEALALSNN